MRLALAPFALAVALASLAALAPTALVEWWARAAFPVWASASSWVFDRSPVSSTLVSAAIAVVAVLAAIAAAPAGRRLRRSVALLVGATGVLGTTFVLAWGATYHRAPLAAQLDLAPAGAELAALEAAFERMLREVDAHAPAAPLLELDRPARLIAARRASECVALADEAVSGRRVSLPAGVRELRAGTLLRAGYGGISLPWLLEPHVDGGLPGAAWLAVATHELTHAAGWAREADTDALSVLAGLACDAPEVRYATSLHGVQLLAAAIAGVTDPDHDARSRVSAGLAGLPDVARADRRALSEAVARLRVPIAAEAVGRVYDAYLRTQGVEAGVADYALAAGIVASALARCPADPRVDPHPDESGPASAAPWCDGVARSLRRLPRRSRRRRRFA